MNEFDILRELSCTRVEFIGEGVYIGSDGYNLYLVSCAGEDAHTISLDPDLFKAVKDFASKYQRKPRVL